MLGKFNIHSIRHSEELLAYLGSDRARWLVTGFICLLSLAVLVSMVLTLIRPSVAVNTAGLVDEPRIENLRWNWFAAPRPEQAELPAESGISEELPNANIRAELLGVVISPWGSYAAISTSANPDGVYAVGDSIENDVTLEAVEPRRVVVSQSGSRRQIALKAISEGGASVQSSSQSDLLQLNEAQSSGQGFNLSGLLSAAPEMVPGVGMGLRLGDLSKDLADLADVQEGDVLIAVNGTAVGDMMSNPVMWQQFSQMTSMPVTIIRNEEQIELFVNGASLSEKILPQLGAGRVQ